MLRSSRLPLALVLAMSLPIAACDDDDDGMDSAAGSAGDDDDDDDNPYAGMTNPDDPGDTAAISAGESAYAANCASCHGENGDGDTPTGMASDPPASDFTSTLASREDDFVFWRISDGVPGTTMIAYSGSIDEATRWNIITYMRATFQ